MTGNMAGTLIGPPRSADECAVFGPSVPPLNGRGIETIHNQSPWASSQSADAHWREARLEARRQRGREFVAQLIEDGPPYRVATDDDLERLFGGSTH